MDRHPGIEVPAQLGSSSTDFPRDTVPFKSPLSTSPFVPGQAVFCWSLQIHGPPFPTLPCALADQRGPWAGAPRFLAPYCVLGSVGIGGGREDTDKGLSLPSPPCGITRSGLLAGSPLHRALSPGSSSLCSLTPLVLGV